jgi:hypothetical protein
MFLLNDIIEYKFSIMLHWLLHKMGCTQSYAQLSASAFLKIPLFTLKRTADYVFIYVKYKFNLLFRCIFKYHKESWNIKMLVET